MNYGYASIADQPEIKWLEEADNKNKYCIQLYHHVVNAVDIKDLDVMEVGSGRGGGAEYINRYFKPNKMVGVDFSQNAVRFCNNNYSLNGLSFETGNAQSLPFKDSSFDIIINVESSHCYYSMDDFLAQVKRVLRKGGYFLFADLRSKDDLLTLQKELLRSGLTLIKETDITSNVVEAMKLDNENKIKLINKNIHKLLVRNFLQFAGTKGSKIHNNLKNRENIYKSFVFQKRTH